MTVEKIIKNVFEERCRKICYNNVMLGKIK